MQLIIILFEEPCEIYLKMENNLCRRRDGLEITFLIRSFMVCNNNVTERALM